MPLVIGASLGPYQILAPLGSGGMGEVYKARDTRLDRTVAIKVLSARLAADPQFRERFDREARAVAALNHPHICALYDVGHQDGTDFLVMEYLEGETLDLRLKRARLSAEQALQSAMQIADALDKAHRAGIVHRDLKPGNVMLTKAGAKLLDFGLAKAVAPGGAATGMSMLPTTPPALTAQGTIIGTFQYMAPEQLEGKEADARTDIFAFGALLYEMLTGRKAFEGTSQASLISSIMSSQPPPVSSIQTLTPPSFDRLVARCLAKDPDDRWQSVRDLSFQLSSIGESGAPAASATLVAPRRSRERLAWTLAALGLLAFVVTAALAWMRRVPAAQLDASQFVVLPPQNGIFAQSFVVPNFAIAPDGRQLAFVASDSGASRLWVRPLSSLIARPLSDTDNASAPFWSPDGRSLGFFASGKLKKVDIGSGAIQILADATFPTGGTWSPDGFILFAPDLSHPLLRVPAGGGATAPVTSQDLPTPGSSHGAPTALPDGRHFLFTVFRGPNLGSVYVGSIDSNEIKPVVNAVSAAFSPPDYLLFAQGSSLLAQRFDLSQLSTTGEPVTIADIGGALGAFAVSSTGTLVYRSGAAAENELVWVDRSGRRLSVAAPRGFYVNVALSPDDKRVAFDRATMASNDVWLMDLQRQIPSRFTFQPPNNNVAVWSPDGQTIAFASSRSIAGGTGQNLGESLDIYQRLSNGSAPDELLLGLKAPPIMFPSDWSRDGRYLAYYRTDSKTQLDQWVLPLFGDRKPFPFLRSEFNEAQGQFSPDGKWMAYMSDESGNAQVYVQSFPTPTGKWQVSSSGGLYPRWNPNGKELFYVALDGKLVSVAVRTSPAFEAESPQVMFATGLSLDALRQNYSVSSDGQRFLLNTPVEAASSPLTVLVNWQALMRK